MGHRVVDPGPELLELFGKLSADALGGDGHAVAEFLGADVGQDLWDEGEGAGTEHLQGSRLQVVPILLQPALRTIFHRAGIMFDAEAKVGPLGGGDVEAFVGLTFVVEIPTELFVCHHRQDALFVQEGQDPCVAFVDEVQHVLVVGKGDELPLDALLFVLFLFELKNKPIELLLQRLIGVVDADLLEIVLFEGLESEDVQDADVRRRTHGGAVDGVIDLFHDMVEGGPKDGLDERLHRLLGLSEVQRLEYLFVAHQNPPSGHDRVQHVHLHPQHGNHRFGRIVTDQMAGVVRGALDKL
mmetsp:Transcript_39125/g.91136  ORF Transcript_39125/g.91136 Transcript_39125/m.91136 type:complete len:298 (+) Transcript_39125:3935-4828(+)